MSSVDPLATSKVGDNWSKLVGQAEYLKSAGEVEARDVEGRYIDMVRGNGRSGLPRFMNDRQKEILKIL